MVKYAAMVVASRLFSLTPQTRRLYRSMGNVVLERMRVGEGLPERYVERARKLLGECRRYRALGPGSRVLEVGTGWLHWEATVIRLLYDVELTLFDVCDNRLLNAYKVYVRGLDSAAEEAFDLDSSQLERVHDLLGSISQAGSFNDAYQLLRADYVVDPAGTLTRFADSSYDRVLSCDVLEHVDRDSLGVFVKDMYRVLKPGGYSQHQIDLSDHFWYFDPGVSRKQYCRFSDRAWNRWFENKVQYFNRVQRPEWMRLFTDAGFELVEEDSTFESLGSLRVAPQYSGLPRQDLECVVMRIVHRKPSSVAVAG